MLDWIIIGTVTVVALVVVVLVGVVALSILALSQLDDSTATQSETCEACGCPTNGDGRYTDDEVWVCQQCYDTIPIQPRWNRVDFGAVERRARLRKLQGGR